MKIICIGDSLTKGKPGLSYVENLQQKLSQHTLINYGKDGDTVVSLFHRIQHLPIVDEPADIIFLWVGTNDILVQLAPVLSYFRLFRNQLWAKNTIEFIEYYHKILDFLSLKTRYIVTVPPVLIGEDVNSIWNQKVGELADLIRDGSASYANATYIDLRKEFLSKLSVKHSPGEYLPRNSLKTLFDGVFYHNPQQIDLESSARGLQFTFDGVHFNTQGTQLVTDIFLKTITSILQRS